MAKKRRNSKLEQIRERMTELAVSLANTKQSNKEFRTIFESAADAIMFTDLDGKLTNVNDSALKLLGLSSKKEILGKNLPDFIALKDRARAIEALNKILREGGVVDAEYVALRPDGTEVIVEARGRLIKDDTGNPICGVAVIRDITERKLAESKIVERNRQLLALQQMSLALTQSIELQQVASLVLKATLDVLEFSSGTIRRYDESTQELVLLAHIGLPDELVREIQSKPSPKLGQGLVGRVAQTSKPLILQNYSQHPDLYYQTPSRHKYSSYVGIPLLVKDRMLGVISIYSKEQRAFTQADMEMLSSIGNMVGIGIANAHLFEQTDESLKQRVAELEALIASMDEGVIVADSELNVRYFNLTAERLLGIRAIDILSQPIGVLEQLGSNGSGKLNDFLKTFLKSSCNQYDRQKQLFEVWIPERRELEVTFFNIDKIGHRFGSGMLLRDVTREREIDRMKTEFVSLASHELRTPMTVIYGFAELLLMSKGTPDEQHSWVERIHREAWRLTNIVDDFLNISRIEAGRLSIKQQAVSLPPILNQLIPQISRLYRSHSFESNIAEDFPELWVDAERLTQILFNLIDNAAKYSPGGGPVIVSVQKNEKDDKAVITVKDKGLGINAEELPKLFTRFHRIRRPETTGIRGTGLGLFIVKSLVEMMGGRVWLESAINQGTTFYVELPLAAFKS